MKRGLLLFVLGVGICVSGMAETSAIAVPFGFYNITNNNAADAAIGEAQLYVDITDRDGGEDLSDTQALFTFINTGPEACFISEIYFDDYGNSLIQIDSFIYPFGLEVSFSEITDPNKLKLPGGNNINFLGEFGAEAESPSPTWGVNPGESLGIMFDLFHLGIPGETSLENVLDDMMLAYLRIGIHVQGFDGGGSESFVNKPVETTFPVPEPATMLMVGFGMIGLALVGRKRILKRNHFSY